MGEDISLLAKYDVSSEHTGSFLHLHVAWDSSDLDHWLCSNVPMEKIFLHCGIKRIELS